MKTNLKGLFFQSFYPLWLGASSCSLIFLAHLNRITMAHLVTRHLSRRPCIIVGRSVACSSSSIPKYSVLNSSRLSPVRYFYTSSDQSFPPGAGATPSTSTESEDPQTNPYPYPTTAPITDDSGGGSGALSAAREEQLLARVRHFANFSYQPITLAQLASPVVTPDFLRHELTVRLAHRIMDFRQLPYVVTTHPLFFKIYCLYLDSFAQLSSLKNGELDADTIQLLLGQHRGVIDDLQQGYQDLRARGYAMSRGSRSEERLGTSAERAEPTTDAAKESLLNGGGAPPPIDLSDFLNRIFVTRIGNRVLAERFRRGESIVTPNCRPAQVLAEQLIPALQEVIIETYGRSIGVPHVQLSGELDIEFAFITEHLIFIMQEILKNALRATIESRQRSETETSGGLKRTRSAGRSLSPVVVEIRKGEFDVQIMVSDKGGGIHPNEGKNIWRYGYTTVSSDSSIRKVAG